MILRGELLLDDVLPVYEHRRSSRRGRGLELVWSALKSAPALILCSSREAHGAVRASAGYGD